MFKLIDFLDVDDGAQLRRIGIYHGDLADIPDDHCLDLLVVSAFPDNYAPTPTSLIGALHKRGLSIATLSQRRHIDLRKTSATWASEPIDARHPKLNIKRVAVFEPIRLASAQEAVGALFRGLFPLLSHNKDEVVGFPVFGAGDQGLDFDEMFRTILDAASHWLARGLPVSEIKIVERDPKRVERMKQMLHAHREGAVAVRGPRGLGAPDIFLSFATADVAVAERLGEQFRRVGKGFKVFDFRHAIKDGTSWQEKIDTALAASKIIVSVLSPDYIMSPECREELFQARLRNKRSPLPILHPIYWRDLGTDLHLWLQAIRYSDCRERNEEGLDQTVVRIAAAEALTS
jgi:TIR domain